MKETAEKYLHDEENYSQYINLIQELYLDIRGEVYYDEVFRAVLRKCCIDTIKVVPVYNDRNVGRRTDNKGNNAKRLGIICAKSNGDNVVVPDYIFVPCEYTYDNPKRPYLMVETKKPLLVKREDKWYYRELTETIEANKPQLCAEIAACNGVLYTDGIQWFYLKYKDEETKEIDYKKLFCGVEIKKEEKMYKRKDCKYYEISETNSAKSTDLYEKVKKILEACK